MVKTTHRILHDWKLVKFLKEKGNLGDVLDVGSKDSRYKKFMEFNSYTSLDIDSKFKPDIVGDIEFFESNKKYDTILVTFVFEHLKNPEIVIKNLYSLLKLSGRIICSTPFIFQNHGEDYWRYSEDCLRMIYGRYFSKVGVIAYGNFISSSWDILHFFNRIPLINWLVAKFSLILSSRHCPMGHITEAVK